MSGVLPLMSVWFSVTNPGPKKSGFARPPPMPSSETALAVTVLLFSTSVGAGAPGMPKLKLAIPPPMPVFPRVSSSAVLPETAVLFSVAEAWFRSPPPGPQARCSP